MNAAAAAEIVARRSRALARGIRADPALLDEVLSGAYCESDKPPEAYLREALALGGDPWKALRRWRRRELIRIVLRDTATSDLRATLRELSDLAGAAIEAAARAVLAALGPAPCAWAVIGMGKLGGRELNLSSDVDLVYLYETDRDPGDHSWFRRFFERLTRLLSDVTEDGFVYRVDLDLRPEGRTGAICNSLEAAERYYEAWGHSWERIAWLRARPVAGDPALGQALLDALTPFVYRRHLDLRALEEVRAMKLEVDRRARRHERDVKLGPGGIREVEFFAQALQLMHGGKTPALRTRDTIEALERLALAGLIREPERFELGAAYLFLRAVENQIQLVEERQTHELPADPSFVAGALGTDVATLEADLDRHRSVVSKAWASLFGGEEPDPPETPRDPRLEEHYGALARNPRSPWHPGRRVKDRDVLLLLEEAIAASADPDQAACLLRDLARSLPRTTGLWSFLRAHPPRLEALVHLLGTSRFLGALVARNPTLLERVVLGAGGPARPSVEELTSLFDEVSRDDPEAFLQQIRTVHQGEVLRIGFYDVAGEIDPSEVARQLSLLAEVAITQVDGIVGESEEPEGSLGIVAWGRLGAGEMTYGSDLDLLFVYDGDGAAHARRARRLISGLTMHMATGRLYEVDTRLRPSGNQGPLLVTFDALEKHHRERAAVWEHMALLRARGIRCSPEQHEALERVVSTVLDMDRDRTEVCAETRRIRERLGAEVAREDGDHVDLKYGCGGLVELDLVIQAVRLLDGGRSLPPRALSTPATLKKLHISGVLESAVARALTEAYAFLRKLESRLRIAYGRPVHRIDRGGPTWELLAKRMGHHDLPGRPGAQALFDAWQRHTRAVRTIYEDTLGG